MKFYTIFILFSLLSCSSIKKPALINVKKFSYEGQLNWQEAKKRCMEKQFSLPDPQSFTSIEKIKKDWEGAVFWTSEELNADVARVPCPLWIQS